MCCFSFRFASLLIAAAGFPTAGCSDDGFVDDSCEAEVEGQGMPALEVTVKNGAFEGRCGYIVKATSDTGQSELNYDCEVSGDDCNCSLGSSRSAFGYASSRFEVELLGRSQIVRSDLDAVIATKTVAAHNLECVGGKSAQALFSQPSIDNFVIDDCLATAERATECGYESFKTAEPCLDTHLAPSAGHACNFGCYAAATCEEYRATYCLEVPPDEPTALSRCVAKCQPVDSTLTAEDFAAEHSRSCSPFAWYAN